MLSAGMLLHARRVHTVPGIAMPDVTAPQHVPLLLRMQTSPGQGILRRRGSGSLIRGDLRERPQASSVALALCGVCGAAVGGALAGGFEGVLVGSGILWMVASFGDVLADRLATGRAFRAEARRRQLWLARAEATEDALQAALKQSPVEYARLKTALSEACAAGVESRGHPQLIKRAKSLLALIERARAEDANARLVHSWEDGTLPFEEWTHRAHMLVAFTLSRRHADEEAATLAAMAEGIRRFNALHAAKLNVGYHETLTQWWVGEVVRHKPSSHATFTAFERAHPQLLNSSYALEHYTRQTLFGEQAKWAWVPPDLMP